MTSLARRPDSPPPSRLTSTGRALARIANQADIDTFAMDAEAAHRRRAVAHAGMLSRQALGEISHTLDVAAAEAGGDPLKAHILASVTRVLANDIVDTARGF